MPHLGLARFCSVLRNKSLGHGALAPRFRSVYFRSYHRLERNKHVYARSIYSPVRVSTRIISF